jgi:hypothetical protein
MTSNFEPRINFHLHLGLLRYSWLTEPFHALPFSTRLSSFEQFSKAASTVAIVPGTLSKTGRGTGMSLSLQWKPLELLRCRLQISTFLSY